LLALFAAAAPRPAAAHIPALHGRLVDLIRRAEIIVLGTAHQVTPVSTRVVDTTVAVDEVLTGAAPAGTITFRGPSGVATGERYVVFLRRAGSDLESIQPSGTLFPSRREDDEGYRRAIRAIAQALRGDPATQVPDLRAALIDALSASAAALRYHAVLGLSALAKDGHGPTGPERQKVNELLASPSCDPALRPLLSHIVGIRAQ
jgi:hypothetical protein